MTAKTLFLEMPISIACLAITPSLHQPGDHLLLLFLVRLQLSDSDEDDREDKPSHHKGLGDRRTSHTAIGRYLLHLPYPTCSVEHRPGLLSFLLILSIPTLGMFFTKEI